MLNKMLNIAITTGGTGGHVVPALSFLQYVLNNTQFNCSIFCDKRGLNYGQWKTLDQSSYCLKISNSSSKNFIIRIMKIFFYFFKWFFQVRKFDVIVSFGSYNSVPILIAAIIWRKKIILQEQNTVISRVNYLFQRFANYLCLSYELSDNYKIKNKSTTIVTGMPQREFILRIAREQPKNNKIFTILIVFGSLDSLVLFPVLSKIFNSLPENIIKNIRVLSNESNLPKASNLPLNLKVEYFEKSFGEKMAAIYKQCDIVICRAGAAFLYEMLILNKQMIVFPLQQTAGDHQLHNAKYIESLGQGIAIADKEEIKPAVEFIINQYKNFRNRVNKVNKVNTSSYESKVSLYANEDILNLILKLKDY